MIERLVISLRQLAALSDGELASPRAAAVRADCADAVRLELDCPQQSLAAAQRAALSRLSDALEDGGEIAAVREAVRATTRALGLDATDDDYRRRVPASER
jgi:hypothetical protein